MTSESGIASAAEAIAGEAEESASRPDNAVGRLPAAITSLLSARVAIMSAESQHATAVVSAKLLWCIVAACCFGLFVMLLIAGLIGATAKVSGLAWFHVTLILAAVFFLVAIIALSLLRKRTKPIFPITRSEFEKDRTWLTSIPKKSTSEN